MSKTVLFHVQLCALTPMGPPGVCARMCVRSMNAPPDYYSLEPDVPLIGGRGWSVEEERQPNNEVRCIRVAHFCCCFTHSAVQFATLWVSSVTLLCLLSPSQICPFSLFSVFLHTLSVSIFFHSVCVPPPDHSYWCGGRCFGPPEGECLWYKKA